MGLFAKFRKPAERRAAVPAGTLIYAVGDVHGRLDLLKQLFDAILIDIEGRRLAGAAFDQAGAPTGKPQILFVGDYIDRGPDSAGVIAFIVELQKRSDIVVHTLRGNHEEAMLTFLDDSAAGPVWAEFGGVETLASYGIVAPASRTDAEGWEAARLALKTAAPPDHLHFLRALDLYQVCGDYVFVHAGLRPGVPLEKQNEKDLLWIRGEFLESNRPFEKVVVYGHTPRPDAMIEASRIGIDTGAFVTGVLTALRLEGEERTLLQTAPPSAQAQPVRVRTVA